MKIGVSACLLGYNVRYNGSNKKNERLIELLKGEEIVPLCPECEAGLPIPHPPIEIRDGKIIDENGNNYTYELNAANSKLYDKAKDCDFLVLKSKSPTCGLGKIYDGTFSGVLVDGNGSFTDFCLKNGLKIYSENDIEIIAEYKNKR